LLEVGPCPFAARIDDECFSPEALGLLGEPARILGNALVDQLVRTHHDEGPSATKATVALIVAAFTPRPETATPERPGLMGPPSRVNQVGARAGSGREALATTDA
jgi:hypothetical protein